jgi:ABC-type amino acid transport system permease subunit
MIDNFNRYVLANTDLLGQGLLVTLRVCVQAFLLAIVLAIAVSLLRATRFRVLRALGTAYV